eukprot:1140484-Pelagomonas_calceolata.AAC.1
MELWQVRYEGSHPGVASKQCCLPKQAQQPIRLFGPWQGSADLAKVHVNHSRRRSKSQEETHLKELCCLKQKAYAFRYAALTKEKTRVVTNRDPAPYPKAVAFGGCHKAAAVCCCTLAGVLRPWMGHSKGASQQVSCVHGCSTAREHFFCPACALPEGLSRCPPATWQPPSWAPGVHDIKFLEQSHAASTPSAMNSKSIFSKHEIFLMSPLLTGFAFNGSCTAQYYMVLQTQLHVLLCLRQMLMQPRYVCGTEATHYHATLPPGRPGDVSWRLEEWREGGGRGEQFLLDPQSGRLYKPTPDWPTPAGMLVNNMRYPKKELNPGSLFNYLDAYLRETHTRLADLFSKYDDIEDLIVIAIRSIPACKWVVISSYICLQPAMAHAFYILARSKWGWRVDPAGTGNNAQKPAAEGCVQRRYPVLHALVGALINTTCLPKVLCCYILSFAPPLHPPGADGC